MAFSTFCSKFAITVISIIFWALAAGVLFLGAWIITAHTKFEHLYDLLNSSVLPACVLLAVGIVLFALGTIGCIGAVREHKCLLGLYISLLVIAFAGLVASIGLAYEYRGKVSDSLHDILKEGLNKYDNDTGLQKAIDLMQNELHCCGVDNYTDWLDTKWHAEHKNESYPASCCSHKICNYTDGNHSAGMLDPQLYHQGCYTVIRQPFIGHTTAVFVVVGIGLFVLLLGLMSACVLMHARRRAENFIYRDLSDTDGMHI